MGSGVLGVESGKITSEDIERFLVLQDATLVQVLLDLYSARLVPQQDQRIIMEEFCAFLHEKFLAQPFLCHLLQQQTYNIRMIPYLVELVPSMRK